HQDVVVSVLANEGEVQTPLTNVRCYLFTADGSYTGVAVDTDDGRAVFMVPPAAYKVRADYLGSQYWSEEFTQVNSDISIIHGEIDLHATDNYEDLSGAKVYLFSESGSYLGRSATTDEYGHALFTVPEGSYTLRVDADGQQYWSDVIHVIAYQSNQIEFEIAEVLSTNNPRPIRYDGKPPVYRPLLASIGSLDGLFTSPVVEEPRTYYFISDHLGTGQLLVDQEQQVVWQAAYLPFGQVDVDVDRVSNNFRFPGQSFDGETGLHYNWHRFYDPATGRYISGDPIGLAGGINLYVYVSGNPVNAIDPRGLTASDGSELGDGGSSPLIPGINVDGTIGVGGYYGGGAEGSVTRTICCENGVQYRVTYVTVCGGAGLSAGGGAARSVVGNISPSASTGAISSSTGCPRTRSYFKHGVAVGPLNSSIEVPLDSHPIGGISIQYPSVGTKYVYCSDTVIRKEEVACCNN
ncbi:MAG: RHS repeat-associated core domain-containing protein, partial [Thermodesulfobacteriota bacterium]|nr:RHS repeat-associated core domain-containing protein [Thermodesulfobacteriota bacterium]